MGNKFTFKMIEEALEPHKLIWRLVFFTLCCSDRKI
jgi:hypothetical protein